MSPVFEHDVASAWTHMRWPRNARRSVRRSRRRQPVRVESNVSIRAAETLVTRPDSHAGDSARISRRHTPCAVCIDDDADFISILDRHLREIGVEVIGATNAVNGMRAIVREHPDVVITDYYMPNAFGTYVLRCLQQDGPVRAIPVIVVTGCELHARVDPAHRTTVEQQLQQLGAASILRKPVSRHALAGAVVECLNGRLPYRVQNHFD